MSVFYEAFNASPRKIEKTLFNKSLTNYRLFSLTETDSIDFLLPVLLSQVILIQWSLVQELFEVTTVLNSVVLIIGPQSSTVAVPLQSLDHDLDVCSVWWLHVHHFPASHKVNGEANREVTSHSGKSLAPSPTWQQPPPVLPSGLLASHLGLI